MSNALSRQRFLLAVAAAALGPVACDSKSKKEEKKRKDDDEDEDDKKKKKKKKDDDEDDKKSSKSAEPAKSSGGALAEEPKPQPAAAGGKYPDLNVLLGSKADGFGPLVFAKLKPDMLPADAGKLFPGGDTLDEFGFAESKSNLPKGVLKYRLTYQEGKLKFAAICFEKEISDDTFWTQLVTHLKTKLAPVEGKEITPGKKGMMWMSDQFKTISVGDGILDPGYELEYMF